MSSKSGGFAELGKLNNLHGCLAIHILGVGEKVTYEPGAAHLKDKDNLESLVFHWRLDAAKGNAKEAFECLEPPQSIKAVLVYGYPSPTFPMWLSVLTNLVRLEVVDCKKCEYLPPLHRLSSLQELTLSHLSTLEYVSKWMWDYNRSCDHLSSISSTSSTMSFFPSLRTLEIMRCNNLKGWWERKLEYFADDDEEVEIRTQQPCFPNLSHLRLYQCPFLTSMPLFPNLEELSLESSSSKPLQMNIMMTSHSVAAISTSTSTSSSSFHLSKLRVLDVISINDLDSLPEAIRNLSSLHSLRINSSSFLQSLPEGISKLTSLQSLTISYAIYLTSLPQGIGGLSSLTSLIIRFCSGLRSLPEEIGNLSSLTHLTIEGCRSLNSLPEGIGNLLSLAHLTIEECRSLSSLPEGICNLSSLRDLTIRGCIGLTSIPNGIDGLPSLQLVNGQSCTGISMDALADYLLDAQNPWSENEPSEDAE